MFSQIYYGPDTTPKQNSGSVMASTIITALAGHPDYLYSLLYETGGGNNNQKIYFTDSITELDKNEYFNSRWYPEF